MQVRTKTVRFAAAPEDVFAFLAKVENLPHWATGFCQELWRDGGDWRARTPNGQVLVSIDADAKTGVIDFWAGPTKTQLRRWPTRVVSDGGEGAVYAFTAIQDPGQTDAAFDVSCAGLDAEFEHIRERVEGRR